VSVYYHITLTIMTRDGGNSHVQFNPQFKFFVQFNIPIL